uniref:Ecdysteroid UDP-glucosyltransferase n=1 Tax=Spodoptera frugiperda nuclear polyhedrosis virus TaxID=10455 RepID=E9L618_NPVSF|nr:EGT [Spodoptera frugiperda multiple nucleopolyhedrovirus]QRN46138.1 EGT [Spodoptera frugiperda multiple nucleopolyhedrovirus]
MNGCFGVLILFFAICGSSVVKSARILAVFPTPSFSHHSVYKVYIQALVEKGHEVVVVKSTNNVNYKDINDNYADDYEATRYNVTEIDATLSQDYFKKLMKRAQVFRKRGLVADSYSVTADNYMGIVRMMSDQFKLPAVQKFLNNKKQKFDLLITEAFIDYTLVYSHLFNDIPVIQISSGYAVAENFETMGAVGRHPVYYPNLWRDKFYNLNVWDLINELYVELRLYNEFYKLADQQNRLLKEQFGQDTPTIQDLRNRVELLFVNTHPVFDNNRPVPPSVQYLGSLHLTHKHPKPIYGTIGELLDNATNGAIYVSFGSGIDTEEMESEFIEMLLKTFEALPYLVLWKYDGYLNRMPENVYIQSWFEQYDLLHHKNIRAFVTQGGVQSTDEAVEALVPVVGMPMMGDQAFNTNKYMELGIGRVVNTVSVNSKELIDAITDVVENPNYRKKINELRHVIRHQAMTPLHKAIWYTEHVINSKNRRGETMLKTKASNVNYSDYVMSYIFVPLASYTIMNHLRQLLRLNFV